MNKNNNKPRALLVFPGRKESVFPEIPLPLLYLSWALKKIDFIPEILDMRICDYRKYRLKDYVFVGITSLSGPTIRNGIQFVKHIRRHISHVPVVWGGVHPSLLPEQTLKSEYVDIIVKSEGEKTIQELALAIRDGKDFSNIKGIGFKEGKELIINPDREFMDLNTIDVELPYELLDMNKYQMEYFPVHTSRGCPFNCGFCYNTAFNKRRWRYKEAERVVDELEFVVKRFGAKRISFAWEDEFFVSNKRVWNICEGIIRRGLNIEWHSFCVFRNFLKVDNDFVKLLERAGCASLTFGAESGSNRILKTIVNKPQDVESMVKATEKIAKTSIGQTVSFMCGFPTESSGDWERTIHLINRLVEINPKIYVNGVFMYTPYPGTPLFNLIRKDYGYQIPRSLEAWSHFGVFRNVGKMPWLNSVSVRKYKTISILTRFPFYQKDWGYQDVGKVMAGSRYSKSPRKQIYYLFAIMARWRWRHKFFRLPLEWWLLEKILEKVRGFV